MEKGLLIFPILKDLNSADGIVVKNEGIRKGFLANGVNTDVLEFNSKGIFNDREQLMAFDQHRYVRIYQYYVSCWERIAQYIERKKYDFIWFRIPVVNPFIARFVKRVKKSGPDCKIIIEYGAYPFVNELTGFAKTLYRINKSKERTVHAFADFVITYCGQENVDNLVNIPINNGIDISTIPVNKQTPDFSTGIQFISVSSLKKWHAYERFITGMSNYIQKGNALPVYFNIVGNGPEYDKLVSLVNEMKLHEHVHFHNFKTGKELDVIYEQNHVAIGTLGFHRIGISNSSSLKNREYFARGLPIVLSTPDQDMPADLPFVKYVPEGEEPVDINEVVAYAQQAYSAPGLHQQIRTYAEERVSWSSKIKTVLKYLHNDADASQSIFLKKMHY